MKQFNGYEDAKKEAQASNSAFMKLPVGAYVCKVEGVKFETTEWGDRIAIRFDVAEGEFKEFFKKQYEANTNEDKKWKGRMNIFVPKDDGSDQDKITKKSFASWIDSFEKSNKGYSWDWDENKWKGKIIGIVFGETGTVIDNKEIVYVEPRFPIEADRVRKGDAPSAKFKSKNGYTGKGESNESKVPDGFLNIPDGVEEEIPF